MYQGIDKQIDFLIKITDEIGIIEHSIFNNNFIHVKTHLSYLFLFVNTL